MNNFFELMIRLVLGLVWILALVLTAVFLTPIHVISTLIGQTLRKSELYSSGS